MDLNFTVFIVDDDDIYIEMLKDELINNEHFTLKIFNSGEDCINNLLLKPEIIVLDHKLNSNNPHAINGLQVLSEIKKICPETEVIILSGQVMPDVTFEYIWKHEVNHYITKDDYAIKKVRYTIEEILIKLEHRIKQNS